MLPNDLAGPDRIAGFVSVLGAAAFKATAVLMLGMIGVLFARHSSAATRHLIWALTLGGALVAPVAAELVPHWSLPIAGWQSTRVPDMAVTAPVSAASSGASSNAVLALTPRASSTAPEAHRVRPAARSRRAALATTTPSPDLGSWSSSSVASTAAIEATPVVAAAPEASRAELASAISDVWSVVALWAFAIWVVGALIALAPTLIGMVRLALLERRARPVRGGRWALLVPSALREIDVRRHVRFIELDSAVMPMTWGIVRPVVLLPVGDFDSSIAQRLDVLRHELAHVRRHDCLTQLVAQIACAVHWFNPLAWIAARQLRVERERACDDEVLRAGAKASEYADYLLRVARSMHTPGAAAFGGLAMARPSQLAGRLLAVLDDRRDRARMSTRVAMRASLVMAVVVCTIASVSPTSASARAIAKTAAIVPTVAAQEIITTTSSVGAGSSVGSTVSDVAVPTVVEAVPAPGVSWLPTSLPPAMASAISGNVGSASLPATAPTAAPCDRGSRSGKGGSHTSLTGSDNGAKRWKVSWSEGDCSFELDARGEIKFNRDVTDIESISTDGSFTLEQHIGDDTKRLVVRPRSDGGLDRSYSENGAKREFDADARAWFANALVELDRETAFAVEQRVPSILERSGVDGVLQEITLLGSDYARRKYYTKLLSMRQLDRAQVRRVVEQAGAEMSSDYELAELLVAVSKLDAFSDDSHTAFVSAIKKIDSDYEARRA
ncbi:MAG TPA: M56 family metallopeptidase, partial [Gemmatimonadaceae bacterium]|nr:M56 family metallopeptidase [Gemmatimonadaceae bacterium]